MATVDDIVAEALAARVALSKLEQDLQEEIDQIRITAFTDGNRPLSPEEIALRNERRAQKAEAQDAYVASTFLTLSALNNSDEVQKLIARMNGVNRELNDDLLRLRDIKRYSETAKTVANGLASVVSKMTGLLPA